MKKEILIISTGVLLSMTIMAQRLDQNWVKQFDRLSLYSEALITTIDSNKYLGVYGDKYYEFDNKGDSTKSATTDFGLDERKSISFHNGSIYIGGVKDRKPAIAKIDLNYDTVWTKTLPLGNFTRGISAIYNDGSDIYVGGSYDSRNSFIAKLNALGDTIWTLPLQQTTFSNFSSIIKLSDGNFLASGNLDDYPLAAKFDSNGDTIWTYTRPIFISFSKSNAFEKSTGDIVLIPERKFVTLDANGKEKSVDDLATTFNALHIENDTLYLSGSKNSFPYVEVRTKNLDSLTSIVLTENISTRGGGVFTSSSACVNGGFVAVGRARDTVNVSANTWNFKLAKFNGGAVSTTPADTSKSQDSASVVEAVRVQQLLVYPNPTRDWLIIETDNISSIRFYNSVGQLMEMKQPSKQVDVSVFDNGVYVLEVVANDTVYRQQIVVRH